MWREWHWLQVTIVWSVNAQNYFLVQLQERHAGMPQSPKDGRRTKSNRVDPFQSERSIVLVFSILHTHTHPSRHFPPSPYSYDAFLVAMAANDQLPGRNALWLVNQYSDCVIARLDAALLRACLRLSNVTFHLRDKWLSPPPPVFLSLFNLFFRFPFAMKNR